MDWRWGDLKGCDEHEKAIRFGHLIIQPELIEVRMKLAGGIFTINKPDWGPHRWRLLQNRGKRSKIV